jgi:ADP-ribose pyrophosphatase YjhB (NUDIX family)
MGILAGWRFCPRCGASLHADADHASCPACGGEYWANSIPGVQGILERDGRVLLALRGREPRLGHWDLPGGFLHENELAEDGLRREFREETGLEIEPARLLRIDLEPYDDRYVFSVSWLVRDVDASREPHAADDVAEVAWFGRHELPAEMAFPAQMAVLREWAGT